MLDPSLPFETMVDPDGRAATSIACPLSPAWRRYIADAFALYAEAEPWAVWVEDDFRLHNHPPLAWGGCFCDRHLAEFSRRAGRALSREEFVHGLLAPGEPHPFRRIWLQANRETWNELALTIGAAVHAVSPSTRVGLMSSYPWVHCAEGRDWAGVQEGLAGTATPPLGRPHLPAYVETVPADYLWQLAAVTRLVREFAPARTETRPELENWPYGPHVDSRAFTRFKLESAAAVEPAGIAMNLFDMMGNGVRRDQGYERMLASSRPFLDALSGLGLEPGQRAGVPVLVDTEASFFLHTDEGLRMEELYPREASWASLLGVLGVASRYAREAPAGSSVVAVSGQRFRSMDPAAIERLFAGHPVLLDGEAALTLHGMGLGGTCGIRSAVRHPAGECFVQYEQVVDGRRYGGIDEARMSDQFGDVDPVELAYGASAKLVTVMKDAWDRDRAPGIAVLNGRVFVFPFARFRERTLTHSSRVMRDILLAFLASCGESVLPPSARAQGPVGVFAWDAPGRRVLLLVNASHDPQPVDVHPGAGSFGRRVMEIRRAAPRPSAARTERADGLLRLERPLEPLEVRALIFDRAKGG
jgi:hypothetical protein